MEQQEDVKDTQPTLAALVEMRDRTQRAHDLWANVRDTTAAYIERVGPDLEGYYRTLNPNGNKARTWVAEVYLADKLSVGRASARVADMARRLAVLDDLIDARAAGSEA